MKETTNLFRNRPLFGVIAVALVTGAAVLNLCGCKPPASAPLPAPIVQVAEVTATNVPMTSEIIGQLDSPQNVEIRARVEAFVDKVLFTEGTMIQEGAMLFELDKKPFIQRLNAAQGGLAEAKAALNKNEKDVARLKPLAEKKAVPQQDLDNAVASVDVGKASVLSAEARVEYAALELSYCDIKAPISGLIGAKQVSIGDLVGRGQPTLLATMSTLDPMWFYCNVSEVNYLKAQEKAQQSGKDMKEVPITLILADGSIHPEQGKIVFVDRAVDVKTGTLRVRAQFPNPKGVLRPGMFGRIRADLGLRPDTILVPERAVTELQGKNFVWVVDADKKATQRPVKVGDQVGENLIILEGLKPGERIITEGVQKVREGAPVQPLSAAEMAEAAQKASAAQPAKE